MVTGYINYRNVNKSIQDNADQKLYSNMAANMELLLESMENLSAILRTPNLSDYIRLHLEFRYEGILEKQRELLNMRINDLNISPEVVERVFYIGQESKGQGNFVKKIDESGWSEEEIPVIEDLQRTGLLYYKFNDDSKPIYFAKGELDQFLIKAQNDKKIVNKNAIKSLIDSMEGKIVICRYEYLQFAVFIVINPDFIDRYFVDEMKLEGCMTLLDNEDRVIWSNAPSELIQSTVNKIKSSDVTQWSEVVNGVVYGNYYKEFDLYNLKLVFSDKVAAFTIDDTYIITGYVLLLLVISIISALIGRNLSHAITDPLNRITSAIDNRDEADSLNKISKDVLPGNRFYGMTIRGRILYYFIISVLIPALASGIMHSVMLSIMARNKLEESAQASAQQMSYNLYYQSNAYGYLLNQISASNDCDEYLNDTTRPSNSQEYLKKPVIPLLIARPSSIYNVSYIILLDPYGAVKYSSVFINKQIFDVIPHSTIRNNYENKDSDIFWLPREKSIFDKSIASVVKKLYAEDNENGSKKKVKGYLQIMLNENAFQLNQSDHQVEFVILDQNNNLVYQSVDNENYFKTSVLLTKEENPSRTFTTNIDKHKHIAIIKDIREANWRLVAFQRMDDVFSSQREVLSINLYIVFTALLLITLLSYLLSVIIVKPLEKIENEMESIGNGNIVSTIRHKRKDEIGRLVEAFNRMIDQINILTQENIARKVKEQELITLKTQAELDMLQTQINPHFLCNTLEGINMQIMNNSTGKASKMINALAQIFRFTIKTAGYNVRLKQELEYVRNYISIQESRFEGKFEVEWDLDPEAMNCRIMKFVIQPIVENSISHGLYEYTSGGILTIRTRLCDDYVSIEISDNGVGMTKEQLDQLINSFNEGVQIESHLFANQKSDRKSIGVSNVYRRLSIFYKGKADMDIQSKPMCGTKTIIRIPFVV
jgi:sensor histidine kinase YesM